MQWSIVCNSLFFYIISPFIFQFSFMFFFAVIRFTASANISLNLFLNIYLFWLLYLSQKIYFIYLLDFFLFSIASSIKFSLLQLILYLKKYVLLCYAVFDINILKNNWLPHLNQTLPFNDLFVLISALCIYRIRYCLVL